MNIFYVSFIGLEMVLKNLLISIILIENIGHLYCCICPTRYTGKMLFIGKGVRSNIGFIGALSAGRRYLRGFCNSRCFPAMPGRRRRWTSKKINEACVVSFSPNPTNAQRKYENRGRPSPYQRCIFGGSRWVICIIWWKRCSPATDPGGPDRRPGGRLGRGVISIQTTFKPPVAQRAGGIRICNLSCKAVLTSSTCI